MTKINGWLPLRAKHLPKLFIMKGLIKKHMITVLNETGARQKLTCAGGMRGQESHAHFRKKIKRNKRIL